MKYIIFDNYFPVVFPDNIEHKQIASGVDKEPTSAGFIENGICTGFSDSLGISSKPTDTKHVKILLKMTKMLTYNPVENVK